MIGRSRAVLLLVCAAALAAGGCDRPGPKKGKGARKGVESCYSRSGLDVEAPEAKRSVFVLVDQTTGLDDRLRRTVVDNLESLLEPGTTFNISTFSASNRDNYPTVLASGTLEETVPEDERSSLSVRGLGRLDNCLRGQAEKSLARAKAELGKATGASASTFTHSEIMGGLAQLAAAVRAAPGEQKLVIVVSDLLEHSDATSFYRNRDLRQLDAEAELAKAKEAGLVADFDGADVAVVGAGMLSEQSDSKAVRNARALNSLRTFWEKWFASSDARLVAWGQPDLVAPLAWREREGEEEVPAEGS